MSETELKPCPFCGGVASLTYRGYLVWVECDVCGAKGAPFLSEIEIERVGDAVVAWNERKPFQYIDPAFAFWDNDEDSAYDFHDETDTEHIRFRKGPTIRIVFDVKDYEVFQFDAWGGYVWFRLFGYGLHYTPGDEPLTYAERNKHTRYIKLFGGRVGVLTRGRRRHEK